MTNAILGIKTAQGQTFTSSGERIPITKIVAGPCRVINALQLGFGQRKISRLTKPLLGHFKKAGLDKEPPRFLREVKLENGKWKPGMVVKVGEVFKVGDKVEVTGVSKGKGFAGVVKRHHFAGGPRTHGQSDRERAPGAIGQTTTPARVYKGKRMAGRMGGEKVTIKNLKVVAIDGEKNLLILSGLVPGGRNSLLLIRKIH